MNSPEASQRKEMHEYSSSSSFLHKTKQLAGRVGLSVALSLGISASYELINAEQNIAIAEAETQGPYEFDNSAIANAGVAEVGNTYPTGWDQPGECMVAAQRWAIAANGGKNFFKYTGGVVSVWTASGGVEVALDKLQPGDILQKASMGTDYDSNWDHVHTAVFRGYGEKGAVKIVDSNRNFDGTVRTSDTYSLTAPLGWGWRAFRFGKAGESTPPKVPWVFENLEGDRGSVTGYDANVGNMPAAVEFNGSLQTFHYDATLGDLRHTWADTTGWHSETLDGAGGTAGRINADLGATPEAIVFNNTLQLLYYDKTNGNLRHAWADGNGWHFETLDGDSGSVSRASANLGQDPSLSVFGNTLQTIYYDAEHNNLRHAWADGAGWHFENLDGDYGSVAGYNANVGINPKLLSYGGGLQAFYYDASATNLRHSWFDSRGWHFENLDGDYGALGHLNGDVGESSTAMVYNNLLHAFYYDKTNGNLRHAWADGNGWHFENLDGDAGAISRRDSNVGLTPTAVQLGDSLQLFYYQQQGGNLVHAFANSTGWHFENLDGAGGEPAGRANANVGIDPKALAFGTEVQLFYLDVDNGNLRHARSL